MQRIARAHGFQRAGAQIREVVLAAVSALPHGDSGANRTAHLARRAADTAPQVAKIVGKSAAFPCPLIP